MDNLKEEHPKRFAATGQEDQCGNTISELHLLRRATVFSPISVSGLVYRWDLPSTTATTKQGLRLLAIVAYFNRFDWLYPSRHCFLKSISLSDSTITLKRDKRGTMVNPGGSAQPPPVGSGSLSWKRCAGCGGKISDRFLLYTMDSYWHSRCLKCSCCQAQLGDIGTSCYTKSGMILCRNDYIRLFGNSGACSACGQSIPASELVMRAQGNVYHLKCFTCSTCRNRLVPGDRFHYINGTLFCEHDRPTALINGHLSSLQTNPLLPDQKVC